MIDPALEVALPNVGPGPNPVAPTDPTIPDRPGIDALLARDDRRS